MSVKLSDREVLFASLVGSRIVKEIPRFSQLENAIGRHVLPITPILPISAQPTKVLPVSVEELEAQIWSASPKQSEDEQYFPLKMSVDGSTWFLLPYEPIINISGGNEVIMRNVAKWKSGVSHKRGAIKERWSQKDYSINITGVLMGSQLDGKFEESFPREDFQKLKALLESATEIHVLCPIFEQLDIHKIVIEDFDFPFSKGENVQGYSIKAVSDDSYNLLIENKDV